MVTNLPGIAAYVEDVVINEGDGPATLIVTLSRAASSEVTLDYQTANGTATAGLDFTSTSGTLTIAAGDTSGSFTIPITDDMDNEDLESFWVELSNAVNATLGKTSTQVSIEDNEEALANNIFVGILDPGSSEIDVTPIILKPTPGGFNQEGGINDYGILLDGETTEITLPEGKPIIHIDEGHETQNLDRFNEINEIWVDLPYEEDEMLLVSTEI